MAQRQLWPDTHFAPEILRPKTTSTQKQLWPRKYFSLVNTLAQKILRPGNNFGPIDFSPLHFGPGTKISKMSFFHHFWPSTGLGAWGVSQGKIKAIITNITSSDQELKNFPSKAQKSKSSKQNIYYVYHTKDAKIIKKHIWKVV